MKKLSYFQGCLIGGAVGDALGYPIEFDKIEDIHQKHGHNGITEYELHNGVAEISDDTQMTLFTAIGLLTQKTRMNLSGDCGPAESYVYKNYQDWLKTQTETYPLHDEYFHSWLLNIPELFSSREPGRTCIIELMKNHEGTIEKPYNQSKGCGGVMRVAPIALYSKIEIKKADMIGAKVAALTHGHELGYIPAAMMVHIIHKIINSESEKLSEIIDDTKETMKELFPNAQYLNELIVLVDKAMELSKSSIPDLEAIQQLGEGWVAEETLAIAIYCSLKYQNDFEKAVIASVNHSGDSDSTGSVTGSILGALLGAEAIPKRFIDVLELKDIILEIADDLYKSADNEIFENHIDEQWIEKYR